MLLKQWGIICCLTVRWEGVTSKIARDGNKSLFGTTNGLPLNVSRLPRCPYITGMRLWSWRDWRDVDVGERPPMQERLLKASQSAPRFATTSVRKNTRAVIIGDSLQRGTESPKCCSDPSHKEMCCLLD